MCIRDRYDNYDVMNEDLVSGRIDAAMGFSSAVFPEVENMVFSSPVMGSSISAVSRKGQQLDGQAGVTVIISELMKAEEKTIHKLFPNAEIKYAGTDKECLEAVLSGKADLTLDVYKRQA